MNIESLPAKVKSLWRRLLHRQQIDADLDDEIRFQLELMADQKIKEGMNPDEAQRSAKIELGGVEQIKEQVRAVRTGAWLDSLFQDIRFALRVLRKNPGFTAMAVITLALGVGANTAIFSVVNAVLLKPLPFPQPDRIVRLADTSSDGVGTTTTIPRFIVWRDQTDAFEDVSGYDFSGPGVNLTSGVSPRQIRAIHVSADYFHLFGAIPVIGRTFSAEEDKPGGPNLVVITSALWRSQFDADPNLIGKTIDLGGDPYLVTGVLGKNFLSDPPADAYLPMQADRASTMTGNSIFVAARLKPGVTLAQGKAAMKIAADRYRHKFPNDMGPGDSATAIPLLDTIVGDVGGRLLLLSGAMVFVLLIACANTASLQLSRLLARIREISVRVALGAGMRRIVRQILTESLLLSIAGGAAGLFLGYVGVRALLTVAPSGIALIDPDRIPRIGDHGSAVTLDWRVLVVTFLAALLTGILSALLPALYVARRDLDVTLRENCAPSARRNRIRPVLAIAEIGMAIVLLVGTFLMLQAILAVRASNPGFDAHNVLTMEISLAGSRFTSTASVAAVVRNTEDRLEAIPGVEAAAFSNALPLQLNMGLAVSIAGRSDLDSANDAVPQWREISPRFFDVFRLRMVRGRAFTKRDDSKTPLVAIINQAMARKYWQNESPIGQQITIARGMSPATDEPAREVIGVVSDFKNIDLDHSSIPCVYVPSAQVVDGITSLINRNVPTNWVVRTRGEPYSLSAGIQREIRLATGGLPVARIRSMDDVIAQSTERTDFNGRLLAAFAAIGLLLAAIGVHGVIAFSARQRAAEIGLRMALGASPRAIGRMLFFQCARLLFVGVSLGLAGSFALSRSILYLVSNVSADDYYSASAVRIEPRILYGMVFAVVVLSLVAFIASWVPARRAMRVDPMVALRHE